MQINSFNHFRAISIIFIVAGHSFGTVGMEIDNLFDISIKNLVVGGSSFFVFISGLLFHHIFYPKYQYKKFMVKKISNVLLPYMILGFVPVFLYVLMKKDVFDGYFLPIGVGAINEYLIPTLKYYGTGRFLTAYWYIPFIMVTFILSPIHIRYIKLGLKLQLLIVLLSSFVSVLIHRPIANISVIQSVIYFTPIYLIGITASIHKANIYQYLQGKEIYLFFIAIVLAIFQAYLGGSGNYHKPAFVYGGIDLMFFQKLVLCFFFMAWLNKFEKLNNSFLYDIASTSFTIFFMHPFILWALGKFKLDFIKQDSWVVFIIFVAVLTASCIVVAKLFKKVFPQRSRYLIGY
jgi:surface polysaccharide O-acyltransferase-like enzyme